MGDARRKMELAARMVKIDLGAPAYTMHPKDFEEKTDRSTLATRYLVNELVAAKFPQGMGRHDGKIWAAWQEIVNDEDSPSVVSVPMGQLNWLRDIASDDELKVRYALAQWREALVDYLDKVYKAPIEEEATT